MRPVEVWQRREIAFIKWLNIACHQMVELNRGKCPGGCQDFPPRRPCEIRAARPISYPRVPGLVMRNHLAY